MKMKLNAFMAYQTSVEEIAFVKMAGLVTNVISAQNAHIQCAVELVFVFRRKIRNSKKTPYTVIVMMDSLETNVKLNSAV